MSSMPPNSATLPAMIPDAKNENMATLLHQELPVAETEAKCLNVQLPKPEIACCPERDKAPTTLCLAPAIFNITRHLQCPARAPGAL